MTMNAADPSPDTLRSPTLPLLLAFGGAIATQVRVPGAGIGLHVIAIPAAGTWLLGCAGTQGWGALRRHGWLLAALALLAAWGAVTAVGGSDPELGVRNVAKGLLYLPLFLGLLAWASRPGAWAVLARVLLLVLLVLALGGVLESFFPASLPFRLLRTERSLTIEPRVASVLSWPNPFGLLMAAGVVLCEALAAAGLVGSRRALAASLLLLFELAQSGSRNAWLTLLVVLVMLPRLAGVAWRRALGLGAILAALAVVLPVPAYQLGLRDVRELPIDRTRFDARALASKTRAEPLHTVAQRAELWRAALEVVREHPVAGIGPGVFTRTVAPSVLGKGPLNAHSLPFDVLTGLGFVGLLLATLVLAVIVSSQGPHASVAGAVLATLLLGQLLDSFLYEPTFVVALATAMALRAAPVGGDP